MGVLNSVIRVFDKDFSVQWFYQSPYAFWAVTLTWLFYAVIVTLIVLNDLMAIPKELIEAAKLDGANGWQLIRFVELPLCRISIGTGMLCSITSRISMYEAIALTTAGGPGDDTMSLSVLLVRAITDYNYGFANAIGVIMFLRGLFTALWSLLFIIPGIVKSYEYMMIPYLLAEHPEMTRQEAFAESKRMMDGNKWNAFVLDLSFIGWTLLGICTVGILLVFYVEPYIYLTHAELYHALKNNNKSVEF